MAHCIQKGSDESCEPACPALIARIGEKGLTIRGPLREVNPNDPGEVAPEESIREIHVPFR